VRVPFDVETRELLAATREVRIETRRPGGAVHSTIIWIVVDGDDVFVRSWKGAGARWFRETRDNPEVVVVAGDQRIPATAVPATDADSIGRCSEGFLAKYRKSQSALAMVADEILDTTLRLDPV
jgi:hypothetical protein